MTKLAPIAVALGLCVFPAAAAAEAIVPPGNSAAAQYTEAFPTAGGDRETEGRKEQPTANKTLGARNAHRLESKGDEGKAVAEFAAETSPAPPVEESSGGGGQGQDGGGSAANFPSNKGPSGSGSGSGDNSGRADAGRADRVTVNTRDVALAEPSGSSGLGEVLGQATGSSSSGKLGLLLPLIVIGAVIWSLIYLWRQRQQGQRVA